VELLSVLAKDEKGYVRWAVAKNINTPPEILAQLAEDEDNGVRRAVAKNPHTPYNTLVMLTKDKNVSVRIRAEEALQERTVKKEQNIGR
jgi:HEAT repeat protein